MTCLKFIYILRFLNRRHAVTVKRNNLEKFSINKHGKRTKFECYTFKRMYFLTITYGQTEN